MALFDSRNSEILDDTALLVANIETAENIQGFTEYVIRVCRGYNSQKSPTWTVRRRFRDFVSLNTKLSENNPRLELPLPPKKIFGNLNREFVAKRSQELQNYLTEILSIPYLALSKDTRTFLDPKNYSINFADLALQNVSMCMRGAQAILVQKTFPNMGWRIRKTYFLVKSADRPKDPLRHLVAWASYGPDFSMDYADAQLALDFLSKIKHSQIRVPLSAHCTERGAVIVKGEMAPAGSLRDVLCNAKPEQTFIAKYVCPKEPNYFDARQLQLLSRKILEVLKFLKDKGIPFGHLHCGNLAVAEDERVQILDIENDILGLPSLYRQFMIQCKAIKTFDDVIVYCFAQTLHEIAVGSPLNQPFLSNDQSFYYCPQPFVAILKELLSFEVTQNALPSLEDLLSREIFVPTWYQTISNRDDLDFRVPSKIKQLFAKCKDTFMERLRLDQTEYRRAIKLKKTEDFMNSDEQKRLRKRAMRMASKEAEAAPPVNKEIVGTSESAPHQPSVRHEHNNGSISPAVVNPQAPPAPPLPPDFAKLVNKPVQQQVPPPRASTESQSSSSDQQGDGDRSALLDSIRNFKAGQLKKAATVDKSAPKV